MAGWEDGDDSFASNPPNAVLSSFDANEVNDVVVVLSEPKLDGSDLSYQVSITDGELAATSAESSLFIDMIGRPLSPVSFAGARRCASVKFHSGAPAHGARTSPGSHDTSHPSSRRDPT